MEEMDRAVRRPRPLTALRLWSEDDWPVAGVHPRRAVAVEWAGQTGHPTSYALLGAVHAQGGDVRPYPGGEAFGGSLAGKTDHVTFGLMVFRFAARFVR